ncbi:MAG: tRNA (adenosine(37)-N6)-threonylcarbamoyltransferase complex transferase subunit TsaD [Verrucomicrobia bacterium]|nr:tRNA (adenosine(37)-N6)-threonylcarbamoyltransferase complex transferase subunit TsaD [Verrucomicrobiota bacterium]
MILAVESSCDESALALFDPGKGMVGEWVHTQIQQHQPFGGVVPELASREHLQNFPILLREVVACLGDHRPDKIVVTMGPGLAGCLALGIALAKALAVYWHIPLYGGNHLRGHAWSPFIPLHTAAPQAFEDELARLLPHLGLIVSGGNTVLFSIDTDRSFRILAETVDDAAGEALDKGAKLLGMPYPGGPLIEQRARGGNEDAFAFPRAFPEAAAAKFSFSGLKTSLRYTLEKLSDTELDARMSDLCASYQEAVVDALARKVHQIARRKPLRWRSLGLSGGVSNNRVLRARFAQLSDKLHLPLLTARPAHTGDNAAMMAFAGWVDAQGIQADGPEHPLTIQPGLNLLSPQSTQSPHDKKAIVTETMPVYPVRRPEVLSAAARWLETGAWARLEGSPETEVALREFHGGGEVWFVVSGTAALEAILLGHEIGPGDEVITTPYTWGATVSAILAIGAIPVFADIDRMTGLLDPASVEACITAKTRAILAVHLFGHACDAPALRTLADKHGLVLLEDGSQAHGAKINGARVGRFGHSAAFSCMGLKPLAGTEGGYAIFSDPGVAERAYLYGKHPRGLLPERARHLGEAGLLDSLQLGWRACPVSAELVRAALPFLEQENNARRQNAQLLRSLIADIPGVTLPAELPGAEGVYHC